MSIVSPYKNTVQYTKIQIKPHQLNSDIKHTMKLVLQKKVEKRCNKNGFIDQVYRIDEYIEDDIRPENFSGACNYNVKYECKICLPIENTIIITQVKSINQELIITVTGPIIIFIPKDNINTNIWEINEKFTNKISNNTLSVDDFVKIQIVNKRINDKDYQIKVIGKMLNLATSDEINKYSKLSGDPDAPNNIINENSMDTPTNINVTNNNDNYII